MRRYLIILNDKLYNKLLFHIQSIYLFVVTLEHLPFFDIKYYLCDKLYHHPNDIICVKCNAMYCVGHIKCKERTFCLKI